jgi:Zn finger protein HypA/HybF involved in hydrogenase expression
MTILSVGTATRDTHYLPVSDHQSKTFLTLRNIMTSLEAVEIERAKLHAIKCPKCKLTVRVKLDDKVCPACEGSLPKPEKR